MTFLAHPYYLNAKDMFNFILSTPKTGWSWDPKGITWHNSADPDLTKWDNYPDQVKQSWGGNYNYYCKVDMRWHSGPHLCATPDNSFFLCDLRADGVHASCFNSDHFGVETIGNFAPGADDPTTGRGLQSMLNAASSIAALCILMGWDPRDVINFHRMCLQDHHPCPGSLVTDSWAISLVQDAIAQYNGASPAPTPVPPPKPTPDLSSVIKVQTAFKLLHFDIAVDGIYGTQTTGVIKAFQAILGLPQTAMLDSVTKAALVKALLQFNVSP